MRKKIILIIVGLISTLISLHAQVGSNWNFVGPYSNNNASGSEFETGQMTKIISDPNPLAPGHLFASSAYAGLWESTNNGVSWANINLSATDLDQSIAIAIKNTNEVLVGNYHFSATDRLSYSTRVSSYNFVSQTWSNYPLLPVGPLPSKCIIKCVAVHPANQSIIYAGTSMGLFRYDGTSWTLIVPFCFVESIVFPDNATCFISGSTIAGTFPNYIDPTGQTLVYVSTDPGNSNFATFSPNISLSVSDPISHTEICAGANSNEIYALTVGYNAGAETRYLHRITKVGAVFTAPLLISWNSTGSSLHRMCITYDSYNNWLWTGGQRLSCCDLNPVTPVLYQNVQQGFHMLGGAVHDDFHGLATNAGNELLVACDGGLAKGSLISLANPPSIYFNRINNGMNVSLINGFSGSAQDPKLYAIGCQDIVNTDIYDEAILKNRYTHPTWENDGAFIYKYDDNIMILDKSSYDNLYYNSVDKGVTLGTLSGFYLPNSIPPFSSSSTSDPDAIFEFGGQRTIQDPFRPGRIFEIGKKGWPGFYQYDFNSKKFARKTTMNTGYFPSVINWQTRVVDLSFSPQTKNSLHLITSNRNNGGTDNTASYVMKYIGHKSTGIIGDIDNCWLGNLEHWTGAPWDWANGSQPQWQEITPNYTTFSSVGGGAVNIVTADLGKVTFKKIETSPLNQDVVYVACNIDESGPNKNRVKCLKYDGTTWVNYSSGVPDDVFVTTMTMDHWSNDGLYLATDKGVFYRDASMSNWVPFYNGLPGIHNTQMEINYKENTVRLGTYGRGIWKSPLQCPSLTNLPLSGAVANGIYEANYITCNGAPTMVNSPTALRGTNSVILNPGFISQGSLTSGNYFFAYIHGCNGGSTSPYLFKTNSSGVQNAENIKQKEIFESVKVYPNPSSGIFIIAMDDESDAQVDVYDVQGKIVRSLKHSGFKSEVNLNNLPKGMYFVNIKSEKYKITKKIAIE